MLSCLRGHQSPTAWPLISSRTPRDEKRCSFCVRSPPFRNPMQLWAKVSGQRSLCGLEHAECGSPRLGQQMWASHRGHFAVSSLPWTSHIRRRGGEKEGMGREVLLGMCRQAALPTTNPDTPSQLSLSPEVKCPQLLKKYWGVLPSSSSLGK